MAFAPSRRPHTAPNRRETDHTFTKYVQPILENSNLRTSKSAEDTNPFRMTGEEDAYASSGRSSKNRPSTRCGDRRSYQLNSNDNFHLDRMAATRMYRVLVVKPNNYSSIGTLLDPVDGRVYNASAGLQSRLSHHVICYDSKKAALSERLSPNQVGATKGGNGRYPRILVAFGKLSSLLYSPSINRANSSLTDSPTDVWGYVKKRYGGGSSFEVENAKLIRIEDFLDPPHPVPERLNTHYVAPFYQNPADHSPPNRLRSSHHFKVNKFFSQE